MHSIKLHDQEMHFSSAHFIIGTDYCEGLHGHNYQVEISLIGPLDSLGMVMDFRDLKRKAIEVCKNLDHKVLLPGKSEVLSISIASSNVVITAVGKRYELPKEDCMILPISATTAEILAQYIYESIKIGPEYRLEVCVAESIGSKGCYSTT